MSHPRADHRIKPPRRRSSVGTQILLAVLAVAWLIPLLWTLYTSLRPKEDTDKYGYFSVGGDYGLGNFFQAWTEGGFPQALANSVIITVPAVVIVIVLASMIAFVISRFRWKGSRVLLICFTAANLLPPQVLAAPLFTIFRLIPLPYWISDSGSLLNTYFAVIMVDVAFQLGFCTFVLSNYMSNIPTEITEAALVDGTSLGRMWRSIVLPLMRPALAALAVLETIWIYNDFFWPLLFIQNGSRLPVTTAINSLQGLFLQNYNLIAAGAIIALIPTAVVFIVLQRQFVAGLTLGSTKG
jgi:multiple sugar transport system permease protein